MIQLDYKLSPGWRSSWQGINLAAASESDLLYRALLGDVFLKVDSHDFSALWGWVPVIHFAASLRQIVCELADRDESGITFEFTESDAALRFKRSGAVVMISASYAPGQAHTPLDELAAAVESFSCRVAAELSHQYPLLARNKAFRELLEIPRADKK